MKSLKQMSSQSLAYSFGSILLTGAFTSAILTTDYRWMNWHFSRLGEGGLFSSMIFNVTLLVSSLFMFTLGYVLSNDISQMPKTENVDIARAKTMIFRAFSAVSICLMAVALFPFDRFPVIHNIFGYSMLFIFMYLCVAMPRILPIFSKRFQYYSHLVIFSAIICYILFIGVKSISLLTVEFVIISMLYLWLILFIYSVQDNKYITK